MNVALPSYYIIYFIIHHINIHYSIIEIIYLVKYIIIIKVFVLDTCVFFIHQQPPYKTIINPSNQTMFAWYVNLHEFDSKKFSFPTREVNQEVSECCYNSLKVRMRICLRDVITRGPHTCLYIHEKSPALGKTQTRACLSPIIMRHAIYYNFIRCRIIH